MALASILSFEYSTLFFAVCAAIGLMAGTVIILLVADRLFTHWRNRHDQ